MNLKTGPITVLFVYIIWCRLQLDDDILFGSVCEIEFCKFCEIYSGVARPPIDSSSLLCHFPYDN